MKQRYEDYSEELCIRAVAECFNGKWSRADILSFVEEYAGISRREIYADELENACNVKNEATDSIGLHLMDLVEDILDGRDPDIEPVKIKPRPDGMTGKVRNIACLCIDHQLLGHLVFLALKPHFYAKFLPQQHASIPGRGQTKLLKQVKRYLGMKSLGIQFYQKTDVYHAYASTKYEILIDQLEKELPDAEWIIKILRFLAKLAPGGSLIIGGYLDAWLFNYAMCLALRYLLSTGSVRRGVFHRYIIRVACYMDDLCLFSRTRSAIEKAVKQLNRWMLKNLNLQLKTTTGIIRLLSVEEEKQRKKMPKPSQRGCPCVDMGGFRIFRTHITMRARIAKRVIRTFIRAKHEIETTGTIRKERAYALIARYGFIVHTSSGYFRNKYDVDSIVALAKKVNGYWSKQQSKFRKEWLQNVISQDAIKLYAASC